MGLYSPLIIRPDENNPANIVLNIHILAFFILNFVSEIIDIWKISYGSNIL